MKTKLSKKPESILVAKTDGTITFVPLETNALAQLRTIVGGDVTYVEVRGLHFVRDERVVVFCRLDGLKLNLPINHYASKKTYRMVVGDAVIAPRSILG